MTVKFKLWNVKGKNRRVIVKRKNGKLLSWRFQKGSGIKTKRQAMSIYRKTRTFSYDRVRLRTKKGSKSVDVKNYDFIKKRTEGYTNVGIIQTKTPIKDKRFQWVAIINIAGNIFTGYSDIKSEDKKKGWGLSESGSRDQAVERAIMEARMSNIIPFYTFEFKYNEKEVLIYDKNKTSFILGKVEGLYAQHYIKVIQ